MHTLAKSVGFKQNENWFTQPRLVRRWTRLVPRWMIAGGASGARLAWFTQRGGPQHQIKPMTPLPDNRPPAPIDGFDFELTDFASAREAHDNASLEFAAEAARPAGPIDWAQRRRAPVPTDRALAGVTIDWMLALPVALRPARLADRLPRLANQIAAVWGDRQRCLGALNGLLTDDRGNRRGLPNDLRLEIQALQQHLADSAAG